MSRPIKYKTEEERNEAKKLARKKYVHENIDTVYEQQKQWRVLNPEKPRKYVKNYRNKNTDKVKAQINSWKKLNKEKINNTHNLYRKKRKLNDPLYKLIANTRCLIVNSFKKYKFRKSSKTAEILGCSFEEFKSHLESKFLSWMTWDNHGKYNGELNYGWDIDHVIPLSSAKSEEELLRFNHFSNLQPLCSKLNRDIKKNKIELSMDF